MLFRFHNEKKKEISLHTHELYMLKPANVSFFALLSMFFSKSRITARTHDLLDPWPGAPPVGPTLLIRVDCVNCPIGQHEP